jgi:spore maturation protein CgeB
MESWFERNLTLLQKRQPAQAEALGLFPPKELGPGEGFEFSPLGQSLSVLLSAGPNGQPFLKLKNDSGERRLSSALNPQGEDRALVERFFQERPSPPPGLTVLGLGLGYHLEFALEKLPPKAPVLAVEARAELASAALTARDMSKLLERPNFTLSVGPLRNLPAGAPEAVLARPTNLRLDPDLYPATNPSAWPADLSADRPTGTPAKPTAWSQPRRFKPPRILFLDADYFLGREIQAAIRLLGSPLAVWSAKLGARADGSDYARLLAQIKDFRPEMVLTVNHLGFDAEGLLADSLNRLGIPMASWFVDSPFFILGAAKRPKGDFFAFSWDSDYLELLKSLGYGPVTHLPLASDPAVFLPSDNGRAENRRPQNCRPVVAFVGDSLSAATDKYLALSGLGPEALSAADSLAADFLENRHLIPGPDFAGLDSGLSHEARLNLAALITWRASRLRRLEILSAFPKDLLEINGDPDWLKLLPGVRCLPRLDYYAALAERYRSAAVNLNVTSAQMKNGLNQRVFDVPACRAFLLTDHRAQLFDLFEPDEVATYRDAADAAEKARFYLDRPNLRERIAAKAHRRVQAEHLYSHRLAKLAKTVMGFNP